MSNAEVVPELRQILGSMIFAANRPLSVREMRKCLQEVAESAGKEAAAFAEVTKKDILSALEDLQSSLSAEKCGFEVLEMAGGYRFGSDPACGKWLKHLLNAGKSNRLSMPGLETLAIVAYRQPVTRAEIEAVRGVSVDHMIKTLMEMQLVKIVGRSDLPGRPFVYGTTSVFLEHFGLKSLKELKEQEPMLAAALANREKAQQAVQDEMPLAATDGSHVEPKRESTADPDDEDVYEEEDGEDES